MKQYKYKNYAEYIDSQKRANEKKKNNVWAVEKNIQRIADYIGQAENGLCHGTRGGYEQKWFRKYLDNCDVFGTEIGDASAEYTVQWDFNKGRINWYNIYDFIYSNSFDHAFNPAETFRVWCNQVKSGGLIILEYDKRNEHTGEVSKSVNKTDPTSITIEELIVLIPQWYSGAKVIDIIDLPVVKVEYQKAVIIQVKHAD